MHELQKDESDKSVGERWSEVYGVGGPAGCINFCQQQVHQGR